MIRTAMLVGLGLVFGAAPAAAQQSASHTLEEHVFNAGGHPAAGVSPASASHRITLGSLGDALAAPVLVGATSELSGGFVLAYPPPGEVEGLRFTDPATLVWDAERSAGRYNLYRAEVSTLGGLAYGTCAELGLGAPTTTDATPVAPGSGLFFLVTVENRLGEEGTKGYRGDGAERTGTVCP